MTHQTHVYKLIIVLSYLTLTGCASVTNVAPPQNKPTTWQQRAAILNTLHQWNVKGLIAFHAGSQANTASLNWHQSGDTFTLSLFGPLGSNAYQLSARRGRVELATPNGQHFYASSPETLLAQQTGWHLPVSNMFYWIRGLPVPKLALHEQFDSFHHLTTLQQAGWTIQYLRYTTSKNIDLPNKIFMTSPHVNVKIIVNNWQI